MVNPQILNSPPPIPNTPPIHLRYHRRGQIEDTGASRNVSVRDRPGQMPRGYDRAIRPYLASHGQHLARNLIIAAAGVAESGSRVCRRRVKYGGNYVAG